VEGLQDPGGAGEGSSKDKDFSLESTKKSDRYSAVPPIFFGVVPLIFICHMMSYVYPKKWAVLFQLDQKAALPVRFLPHFSAQEDPTLSGVSSIFYDLAEANPLVTFLFSIFHIYIYIMCLTMFR
jgi:hypothetical protein